MQLDHSNTYLKEHNAGIVICIEIPDQRNYLHCNSLDLGTATYYKQDIIKQKIGSWNTIITRDGEYYRVVTTLNVGEQLNGENNAKLQFHSRKLNLNDAEFEYFTIIQNGDEK